ncbi:T9SS type A sorting domain-containing protein [Rosettibacter firmus]|uniref:T9SS type A sorting domain-containing protein n=1 Tax=Rosettibacter firmus TaxID=3111522 RepID=UPI00336BD52C
MNAELLVGQQIIKLLNNVPESFKKTYLEQKHEYNPLHVGDMWQYYLPDDKRYVTQRIVKDTINNNKKYFLRIVGIDNGLTEDTLLWERYDSLTATTYTFDVNDYNNDGNRNEEFLVDSLDAGFFSRYQSYKFFFKSWGYPVVTALIQDTGWVEVWGDTVQFKLVGYDNIFTTEMIADKYGLISFWTESPARYLTGAIINGKQYGTIVSFKKEINTSPEDFGLEQNYPNPFNPSTTIEYNLPISANITLKIFNILGKEVGTLAKGYRQRGKHKIIFNARNLPSGIYFYTLYTSSKIIIKQMLLIK